MPKSRSTEPQQSKDRHKKDITREVKIDSSKFHPELDHQADFNGSKGKASNLSNQKEGHSQESVNEKPNKDLIVSYVERFLQQRSDFCWLTQSFDRSTGTDHFQNLVVRSTFPTNLTPTDFEYYIDMTFNDFPTILRTRMKDLYQQNNQNPISEDIILADHENGAISATLVQILSQKNDRDELEIVVGSVSLTRKPRQGYQFCRSYWEQHKDRIKTALQYMYGKEAQKELSGE